MMYSKKFIYLFLFLVFHTLSYAQSDKEGVGINTTDPMRTLDVNGDMRITKTVRQMIRDVKTITSSGTQTMMKIVSATHTRVLVQTTETKTISYEDNGVTKTKTINLGYVDAMDLNKLNDPKVLPHYFNVVDVPEYDKVFTVDIGDIKLDIRRKEHADRDRLQLFISSSVGSDDISYQFFYFKGYFVGADNGVGGGFIVRNTNQSIGVGSWQEIPMVPGKFNINNSIVKGNLRNSKSGNMYFIYIRTYFKYDVESNNVLKEAKIENNPRRMMVYVVQI